MVAELFLPCGRVALISNIDYERCRSFNWYADDSNASGKPYVRASVKMPEGKRTTIYLHRLITNCPPTLKADHRDTDTFNNQRPNLRITTFTQNNANRTTWSLSGFKGVSMDKSKYRARIYLNGEEMMLGRFNSAIEAAKAYDDRAYELFGEFAWLNFPERYPLPNYDVEPEDIPFF